MRIRQFENNLYVIQNENKNLFQGKRICAGYLLFVCICILYWRSNCQEGEDWNPINWFNSTTLLCLSQDRTLISNIICCGLFTHDHIKCVDCTCANENLRSNTSLVCLQSERQMSY